MWVFIGNMATGGWLNSLGGPELSPLDRMLDRYTGLGLLLVEFGVPFALFAYFVLLNTPLSALGLGCLIIGSTLMLIPSSPVPKETVWAMVEGSCLNVEALLEEFDARWRAVYLPPRQGLIYAYAPLSANPGYEGVSAAMAAPIRVFSDAGGGRALMIFPPGSEVVRIASLEKDSSVDEALSYILVDFLEAVESVKAVRSGDRYILEMSGARVETRFPRFELVLGSLPTSIAGCILASVLGKPVALVNEDLSGRKTTISSFKVFD